MYIRPVQVSLDVKNQVGMVVKNNLDINKKTRIFLEF